MPKDKEFIRVSKPEIFAWIRKHYFILAAVIILAAIIFAQFNVVLTLIFAVAGIILIQWAWACYVEKKMTQTRAIIRINDLRKTGIKKPGHESMESDPIDL